MTEKIVSVVYQLLPGFLAAWIFFGLTPHPKTSEFERTVQAFILTGIVKVLLMTFKGLLFLIGYLWKPVFVAWQDKEEVFDADLFCSFLLAIFVGLTISIAANKDWVHKWLRRRGITMRTSMPSEWTHVLGQGPGYIRLSMKNGDLIDGWNNEFPETPDHGHFVLDKPRWQKPDTTSVELENMERILVPAKEVSYVLIQKRVLSPQSGEASASA